jgi:hypothetical protein
VKTCTDQKIPESLFRRLRIIRYGIKSLKFVAIEPSRFSATDARHALARETNASHRTCHRDKNFLSGIFMAEFSHGLDPKLTYSAIRAVSPHDAR